MTVRMGSLGTRPSNSKNQGGDSCPEAHCPDVQVRRHYWKGICGPALCAERWGNTNIVSKNRYRAREAAAALLRMAKATSDPAVAAGLIEAAAKIRDEAGELSPQMSAKAPDVQPED